VISKRVLILDEDKKIVPFPTYEIRGVVTDIASGKPITDAKISININTKAEDKSTNATGTFNSYLIDKYEFETHIEGAIKVDADGYLSASQNISTDLLEDSVVVVNFQLESSGKGFLGPYVINYQFDKYKLTTESKTKLEEVIKLMNDNPAVKIEIRSHTDSRGPKHYNQWLSEMRANTAAEYLKSKVSSPNRISFKGFGESELLKPCGDGVKCSDEEHYENRRTEFIILN
jgi:outer membrane protein OmpA-like peptidoglycan-associated protein